MKRTVLSGAVLAFALSAMAPQSATAEQRINREEAGAAIAAIIALGIGVAIATHGNDHDSGWDDDAYGQPFSPSPNVVCLPRPRQCFERSHYSARWTRRIFGS